MQIITTMRNTCHRNVFIGHAERSEPVRSQIPQFHLLATLQEGKLLILGSTLEVSVTEVGRPEGCFVIKPSLIVRAGLLITWEKVASNWAESHRTVPPFDI